MTISSKFQLRQYGDDDYWYDNYVWWCSLTCFTRNEFLNWSVLYQCKQVRVEPVVFFFCSWSVFLNTNNTKGTDLIIIIIIIKQKKMIIESNLDQINSNRIKLDHSDQTQEETVVVRDITGILLTIYYSDLNSLRLWLDTTRLSSYQGQSNA